MTYNLSPDKILLTQDEKISVEQSGKTLHEIKFKFNDKDVLAWSICHNNVYEEKEVYVKILEKLFNERSRVKNFLHQ